MAKGENEENLIKNAQDISGLTYQYVDMLLRNSRLRRLPTQM